MPLEKTIMKNPFAGLLLILTMVAFPAIWNAAAAVGPSEQDRRFVEAAARAEASRIEAAEQALTKASDKRVRILAERIIEDHRPINEELTSFWPPMPGSPSSPMPRPFRCPRTCPPCPATPSTMRGSTARRRPIRN